MENLCGQDHWAVISIAACSWNVDDVRADIEDAQYAVFDDIQGGFQFFPAYKGWLGAQQTFTVTDKYRGKTTINWGRPSIWLMNDDPEEVGACGSQLVAREIVP